MPKTSASFVSLMEAALSTRVVWRMASALCRKRSRPLEFFDIGIAAPREGLSWRCAAHTTLRSLQWSFSRPTVLSLQQQSSLWRLRLCFSEHAEWISRSADLGP